jgi:hypothetical protein
LQWIARRFSRTRVRKQFPEAICEDKVTPGDKSNSSQGFRWPHESETPTSMSLNANFRTRS